MALCPPAREGVRRCGMGDSGLGHVSRVGEGSSTFPGVALSSRSTTGCGPIAPRRKEVKGAAVLSTLQRQMVSADAILPGIRNLIEKFDRLP